MDNQRTNVKDLKAPQFRPKPSQIQGSWCGRKSPSLAGEYATCQLTILLWHLSTVN
jgi:hypothetical protein